MPDRNRTTRAEKLLSTSEACKLLQKHPNTLRKWDRDGVLTALRIGPRGHRRYRKADIEKLLKSGKLSHSNRPAGDLDALLLALNDTALVSETDWLGNISYANDKFIEISKYSREELIGRNHRILKSGYHSPQFYMKLWGVISNGEVWRGKIKNRAKDGTFYWVDTSIAPIMDQTGRPTRYISVRFPITEQMELQENLEKLNRDLEKRIKQRTRELRKSEKHFRDLTNSMPQLVWTADKSGKVDYYNEKYKNYRGIKSVRRQYVWAPVVHPNDSEKTLKAWETSVKTGSNYEVEHRVKMKDGNFRWHLSRAVLQKDDKGNSLKWYGASTDIHERILLERQKDEFLIIASHELKTPVTSIKVFNQVLQQYFSRKRDARAVELLGNMDRQLGKLTVLITDLLDVTKIESGKLKLRKEYFDLNKLVLECVEVIQRTDGRRRIVTQLSAKRKVYADRERVGQVITNLLTNAVKYSPGKSKVVVESNATDGQITLCVQDFGIGIPKNKQSKIFNRFYRVEGEKEATYPGLGLGLYISREFVKRHGGKITVQSKEGEGSVFCFSLPLR